MGWRLLPFARRAAEREQAREVLRRASELPVTGSPAGLLNPRRGVVGFLGRERELVGRAAWCGDGRPRGVRLVTGPGGVGKTRLSVELCARMTALGWVCVRPGDGGEAGALDAARRLHQGPVLVVVDYAETRAGLEAMLRAVAGDGGPVRVLLLARGAGEWWERLSGGAQAVRELLAEAGPGEALPVPVAAGLSNDDIVAAAVPAFARALGVAPPGPVRMEAAGMVPVLDLHAAALVAVLRSSSADAAMPARVAKVLDDLLGQEARFWQGSATRAGLTEGPGGLAVRDLRRVVAAGALLGAATLDEAVAVLDRVRAVSVSVLAANWLWGVYPPAFAGGWVGCLAPDRLAERLVVAELGADPELAECCLSRLDERQALRSITVLGRAAADEEDAGGLLERVLPLVERVVAGLPADLGLLTAISDAIPYPSVALARADLAVTRRIVSLLPPGEPALRARWLSWLGTTLAQIGQPARALSAEQEATAIRRELAAASPGHYRPDLASSLSNLGVTFSELGRAAEALPVTQEAVAIRRELAAASPGRYRPDLARSLTNLGNRFSELGRAAEALPAEQQAVAMYQELDAARPDRYRPDLASSLNNLGVTFSELGRPAEALTVTQEAAAIRRELAAANPDRYRPDLARSLTNLGNRFSELGRPIEALTVTQEAVAIRRELAAASPGRYRSDLAAALTNLGIRFSALGRAAEALPVTEEAVAMYRELAAANPDRYCPDLARSLTNLGNRFSERGGPAEALTVTQEAVAIRRELAAANPGRYRPDLALSLTILGNRFSELGFYRSRRCPLSRRRWRTAGSWPPPDPAATAPTWPAR